MTTETRVWSAPSIVADTPCLSCGRAWGQRRFAVTPSRRYWYHERCAEGDGVREFCILEQNVLDGLQPALPL